MTKPDREQADPREGAQERPRPDQEGFAISPSAGWLPRIYVPQSPTGASPSAPLWQITVTAARWARRHLSHHRPDDPAQGEAVTDFPADLRYSTDHLWARRSDNAGPVRVGVTDFAQVSLGDVVDVTLPRLGETVTEGEPCGVIESTKSVNDLVAPVTGTVASRNDELADSPDLVNTDPYGQGWMFEIDTDPATVDQQLTALMDAAAYRQQIGE